MPVQYFDSPTIPLTYEQLTSWAIDVNAAQGYNVNEYLSYINMHYPDADLSTFMLEETDKVLDFVQNGDGTYTVLGYRTPIQDTIISDPFNSNTSQVSRGTIRQAINDGVKNVGGTITRNMTTFPASGSFAQQASYVIGSVGSAIAAVSTGITLGKLIDSALYNANPDYWDSVGMSSLNPETWNSITNGDDSPYAGLFNLIMGLDPNTGKSQMYMDADALAYMAYMLKENGWFASGGVVSNYDDSIRNLLYNPNLYPNPLLSTNSVIEVPMSRYNGRDRKCLIESTTPYNYLFIVNNTTYNYIGVNNANTPFTVTETVYYTDDYSVQSRTVHNSFSSYLGTPMYTRKNNTLLGVAAVNGAYSGSISASNQIPTNGTSMITPNYYRDIATIVLDGSTTTSNPIEGVTDQENANLPDTSTWTDIPSTLTSLQTQYPDLWNNSIGFDNIQPDGTVNRTTYVPVAMPSFSYNNDQQPISGTNPQTQTNTQYDPSTTDQTILQLLTDIITATQTQTSPEPTIPPNNPVDVGTGENSPVVPPTGNASALWSVYHPTQAQVDSFGAWLWGSPFLTNIGKLFQNPIDGIISLHKIFVTPVDSGSGTIVVGTLDSEVPSATVNQQYVYVNCGSVNCYEYFGNVFDYPPYTQVSLYLPFIGIVPLDTNDVMRSSINVSYGVDVYTGACLAMVSVNRDGYEVNMYQYAGVASVEYPLSNVQNGQLVSGLLAIGAGVASMIATGGITAPAAGAVAAGVATSAKSSVSKSGGFSGNSGAMGIKKPYLIIQRPQTKVADSFVYLNGYPTNVSGKLNQFNGQVKVSHVHVEGVPATDTELSQIETLLKDGVLI